MSLFKELFRNMAMGGHHGKKYGSSHSNQGYSYYNATPMQTCPKCNTAQAQQAQFCNQCGTSLAIPNCSNCGMTFAAGAKFCSQCGQPK